MFEAGDQQETRPMLTLLAHDYGAAGGLSHTRGGVRSFVDAPHTRGYATEYLAANAEYDSVRVTQHFESYVVRYDDDGGMAVLGVIRWRTETVVTRDAATGEIGEPMVTNIHEGFDPTVTSLPAHARAAERRFDAARAALPSD